MIKKATFFRKVAFFIIFSELSSFLFFLLAPERSPMDYRQSPTPLHEQACLPADPLQDPFRVKGLYGERFEPAKKEFTRIFGESLLDMHSECSSVNSTPL